MCFRLTDQIGSDQCHHRCDMLLSLPETNIKGFPQTDLPHRSTLPKK